MEASAHSAGPCERGPCAYRSRILPTAAISLDTVIVAVWLLALALLTPALVVRRIVLEKKRITFGLDLAVLLRGAP